MAEDTEKLLTRTPLPYTSRLSGQKFGMVALTAFGLLLIYLFITLTARQRVSEAPKPPAKPNDYEVTGTPTPDVALRLQNSYAGWNREPPPPPKTPLPPTAPDPTPLFTPMTSTSPVITPLPPAPKQETLPASLPTGMQPQPPVQ